ncbi:MAG TPA: methyl-accepting chemotaxis protein [Bacteroidales bacterium]|nr:methyl-accepting chemotaxis protein [Bacteroidales bacterium]
MRIRDLKTKFKLSIGFSIIIVLCAITGFLGLRSITSVQNQSQELTMIKNVQGSFLESRLYMRTFLHLQDTQYYTKALQGINHAISLLDTLNDEFGNSTDRELVGNLSSSLKGYKDLMTQNNEMVIKLLQTIQSRSQTREGFLTELENRNIPITHPIYYYFTLSRLNATYVQVYKTPEYQQAFTENIEKVKAEAAKFKNSELPALIDEYERSVTGFITVTDEMKKLEVKQFELGKQTMADSEKISSLISEFVDKTTRSTIVFISLILIISIVVGILLSYFITVYFTRMLSKISSLTDRFASGDLTYKIDESTLTMQDELGALARSVTEMGKKIKETVNEITQSASNVLEASQQLSVTTRHLSEGASQQASSVEEISSSMEEMVSSIQQNADNSMATEKISLSAAANAGNIKTAANESMDSIRNIAEKIIIINDIAFQTNILALNAAVEAARAGEYGRGFAVVAAEVRKLAEKSKLAADEIGKLSSKSVSLTENSSSLLDAIVPEIEKTAKLVQEISAGSMEQNSGAEQVNNAIQQLNHVTQENASVSEEIATTADSLASQANHLNEVVSYFKTDSHN